MSIRLPRPTVRGSLAVIMIGFAGWFVREVATGVAITPASDFVTNHVDLVWAFIRWPASLPLIGLMIVGLWWAVWELQKRQPATIEAPQPQLIERPPALATSSPPIAQRRPPKAVKLVQHDFVATPDISNYTPDILACIEAIIADSPIPNRTWRITDKLGEHQSEALSDAVEDVIWGTVTAVHLLAGTIPGGPYATGQPASLSLHSGVKKAEYHWSDPALLPDLQRAVYRIEQCFSKQAEGGKPRP